MKQSVKVCNTTNLENTLKEVSSSGLVVMMAPSAIFEQCVVVLEPCEITLVRNKCNGC